MDLDVSLIGWEHRNPERNGWTTTSEIVVTSSSNFLSLCHEETMALPIWSGFIGREICTWELPSVVISPAVAEQNYFSGSHIGFFPDPRQHAGRNQKSNLASEMSRRPTKGVVTASGRRRTPLARRRHDASQKTHNFTLSLWQLKPYTRPRKFISFQLIGRGWRWED